MNLWSREKWKEVWLFLCHLHLYILNFTFHKLFFFFSVTFERKNLMTLPKPPLKNSLIKWRTYIRMPLMEDHSWVRVPCSKTEKQKQLNGVWSSHRARWVLEWISCQLGSSLSQGVLTWHWHAALPALRENGRLTKLLPRNLSNTEAVNFERSKYKVQPFILHQDNYKTKNFLEKSHCSYLNYCHDCPFHSLVYIPE